MTCKYCGAETKWPEPYVQGALMINSDGSEHRCKGKTEQKFDRRVTGETGSISKEVQQVITKTLAPQAKEDATLDNVILRENLLLDQIEDAVTNHIEKKHPHMDYNGAKVGMRVKEIYRKITG